MRRYHAAHATPTNALRETIQTQVRGGTLSNPPKRNTAAGTCKTANSSELTATAVTAPLLDAARTRSKALTKNSRHKISSPHEAGELARSPPRMTGGRRGAGGVARRARWINAIAPPRPGTQGSPVASAQGAGQKKRSGLLWAQWGVTRGPGPGFRARAGRPPARASKP